MSHQPIIFGKHSADDAAKLRPESVNPCVNQFGAGPAGQQCYGCVHLSGTSDAIRCRFRKRRDRHSRFWPACSHFEKI